MGTRNDSNGRLFVNTKYILLQMTTADGAYYFCITRAKSRQMNPSHGGR